MGRTWLALGALLGGLGVAFGAFGAHLLKDKVLPDQLSVFETAVRYQFYHALALLAVGLLSRTSASASLQVAGLGFALGTLVFSGSLYLLVLSGQRWLGAITPIGGVGFLVGWAALVWFALCNEN